MVRPAPFFNQKNNTMIKVKWIKAHFRFAYSAGQIGFVTPENAAMLQKGGYIMILPEEEKEIRVPDKVNPLPEDLPGRDKLFEVGFDSILKIKEAGDSLLDAGISNTTFKKIVSYLKKYVFE
jgi:hypothetical protein